ncbi:MAG: SufB/SufD family protein [Candidatus Kapaibacterium sp.]
MSEVDIQKELFRNADLSQHAMHDKDTAYLSVHLNKVTGMRDVPGFHVEVEETEDGINANIMLEEGVVIKKPVHMCFGIIPENGRQQINMKVHLHKHSKINIRAHCVFPNAVDIVHAMDAEITLDEGAEYTYHETHVHGETGGIKVIPKAVVNLGPYARFKTDFELLEGRVGLIDIDYHTNCGPYSTLEMNAKIYGKGNDVIKILESGSLNGEGARGVLTSYIAVRDNARAEINNKLIAKAPGARGHVDCKEIIKDNATAMAVPIVEVQDPRAHVTHEAAIGAVDNRQLETLMARGLDEETATDLIIAGLLS